MPDDRCWLCALGPKVTGAYSMTDYYRVRELNSEVLRYSCPEESLGTNFVVCEEEFQDRGSPLSYCSVVVRYTTHISLYCQCLWGIGR